ncbi:hypothetical protein LL06_18770 [Hoeflea sp. BAL378]|nr:hypothetical protein LL06_18770 [Hoeflea sp. BAL378]
MMSPALKHCLLENDIIFEYSRKLAATCGPFELLGFRRAFTCSDKDMSPRHLLTIIVLFVPDAFFLLAGDANPGYPSFVYRN